MIHTAAFEALHKALSGLGVDEKSLISSLGKSHPQSFRKENPDLFIQDERSFERFDHQRLHLLRLEFARFEDAIAAGAMHPWERDARLVHDALRDGTKSYGVIVEISCTRSSEQLLGARKAYHSLFDHSIEEHVASFVSSTHRKLLVALVSAYRYEGPKIKDETAKSEAKTFAIAIKNGGEKSLMENDEVIRILSTRSKPHLQAIYKHYKEAYGKSLSEDLEAADLILKETVECLCTPHAYFSKVLDAAMSKGADNDTKKALTRVIVSRADVDLKEINQQYNSLYGVSLSEKVDQTAKGNYKDFLLALISRGELMS